MGKQTVQANFEKQPPHERAGNFHFVQPHIRPQDGKQLYQTRFKDFSSLNKYASIHCLDPAQYQYF